ncbi:MAG: ATP-binding protein [Thermodesulfobacteriota bacterium]|nr:ATP-binding protein [Thermodesulfobacteriota bacterium]
MIKVFTESKVAIVGGGKVCKEILKIVLGPVFNNLKSNILGVCDIDDQARGFLHAKKKGIYTTCNYRDLFKFEELNTIVELTGNDHFLQILKKDKPRGVRLIDHFEAMSLWDFLQIEVKKRNMKDALCKDIVEAYELEEEICKRIDERFEQFSQELSDIVSERTSHLQSVEKMLVRRDQTISQIVHGSSIPTFVIDENHVVTHWNKALERMTDHKAGDVIGTRNHWKAFYSEERPCMADLIVDGIDKEGITEFYSDKASPSLLIREAYQAEDFFPDIGGSDKWLLFTAAPIRGLDGKISGSIETLWDTTDQKEAEQKLVESYHDLTVSEEKYRTMFDADPNPIIILDKETLNIIDVNATAVDCYEYSRDEFLRMPFSSLAHQAGKEILEDLKKITIDHSKLYPKKLHRKKGGELFYVNLLVRSVIFMERDCLIAATPDITENVERENLLVQASKMATLGTMVSGIAHELNQPLNVIQVCSDYFMKIMKKGEDINKEDLYAMAEEIGENVQRADQIINHMRDFARQSEVKSEKISINAPILDVFEMLGQQLRVHRIEVDLDLTEDLHSIIANHNRLEQVFMNLVTNAMDALDEKDTQLKDRELRKILRIKSFSENGWVMVTVYDNGTGISEDIKDKIFEPFFTTKEVGKGVGLGTSISYGIVDDYGGTIKVESEVGKGTTFKLSFPAAP